MGIKYYGVFFHIEELELTMKVFEKTSIQLSKDQEELSPVNNSRVFRIVLLEHLLCFHSFLRYYAIRLMMDLRLLIA